VQILFDMGKRKHELRGFSKIFPQSA